MTVITVTLRSIKHIAETIGHSYKFFCLLVLLSFHYSVLNGSSFWWGKWYVLTASFLFLQGSVVNQLKLDLENLQGEIKAQLVSSDELGCVAITIVVLIYDLSLSLSLSPFFSFFFSLCCIFVLKPAYHYRRFCDFIIGLLNAELRLDFLPHIDVLLCPFISVIF